jgi:nucleotidyltransferase substrate binding protein (TIGR01987 family)
MLLDLSAFNKAIAQGREAIAFYEKQLSSNDLGPAVHIRAGAIQAFEFTYELSLKTLQRYLALHHLSANEVAALSFNDLIRKGLAVGLLRAELALWKQFRKDRGTTSHTYDETKAMEVYHAIPAFLDEAQFLSDYIDRLQKPLS